METLPLATVQARLSELVDRVAREHDRVTITREGQPDVLLISLADLEGFEETLEIMSDPEEMAAIREGQAAAARGDVVELDEVIRRHRLRSG